MPSLSSTDSPFAQLAAEIGDISGTLDTIIEHLNTLSAGKTPPKTHQVVLDKAKELSANLEEIGLALAIHVANEEVEAGSSSGADAYEQ